MDCRLCKAKGIYHKDMSMVILIETIKDIWKLFICKHCMYKLINISKEASIDEAKKSKILEGWGLKL